MCTCLVQLGLLGLVLTLATLALTLTLTLALATLTLMFAFLLIQHQQPLSNSNSNSNKKFLKFSFFFTLKFLLIFLGLLSFVRRLWPWQKSHLSAWDWTRNLFQSLIEHLKCPKCQKCPKICQRQISWIWWNLWNDSTPRTRDGTNTMPNLPSNYPILPGQTGRAPLNWEITSSSSLRSPPSMEKAVCNPC